MDLPSAGAGTLAGPRTSKLLLFLKMAAGRVVFLYLNHSRFLLYGVTLVNSFEGNVMSGPDSPEAVQCC